jgi:5,5'-dehydrodivanillate O-demethylase
MEHVESAQSLAIEETGPRTFAGQFMRRFWHPIFLSKDLKAGRSQFIRILSEEFTLYRSTTGQAHLIGATCAHRGARLALGWVEDSCIRCRYHGWKYDSTGQCTEQPAEESRFAQKVKIPSYPAVEKFGLIFAFFGEGAPPPFPNLFEGELECFPFIMLRKYNYFQDLENLIDDVHLSFLHSQSAFRDPAWERRPPPASAVPSIFAEETTYGLVQSSKSKDGRGRSVFFLMPNAVHYKTAASREVLGYDAMIWCVPVDDCNHLFFSLAVIPKDHIQVIERLRSYTKRDPEHLDWRARMQKLDDEVQSVLRGEKTIDDLPVIDPVVIHIEDAILQSSQGVVRDPKREHLGRSDTGLSLLRKIWNREVKALADALPPTPFRFPQRLADLWDHSKE